jgi:CubicO group peptidase (beta-lactamase class C family)
MWSSVEDLYRWYRSAWRGSLLSEASRGRMFDAHLALPDGTGIGYGTFISPTRRGSTEIWARGTEDFGHNAVIRWFPEEDTAVIVLSNSGEIDGIPANQRISNEIIEILFAGRRP